MARSPSEVAQVLELVEAGHSALAVARVTGIPRSTVRDWIEGRVPAYAAAGRVASCAVCGGPAHDFERLTARYAYLLGLYLGDGCISAHRRGVYRLRIFLDARYPGIVDSCARAIREVMPGNKVGRRAYASDYSHGTESTVQLSSYSRSWPCLFPQHGPGKKHERSITLVDWQQIVVRRHPEELLCGLIHSDGCRFMNTGRAGWRHPRYAFSNLSDDIRGIFCDTCDLIGVRWTRAPNTVYVSRVADVAKLDEFIGPKA